MNFFDYGMVYRGWKVLYCFNVLKCLGQAKIYGPSIWLFHYVHGYIKVLCTYGHIPVSSSTCGLYIVAVTGVMDGDTDFQWLKLATTTALTGLSLLISEVARG